MIKYCYKPSFLLLNKNNTINTKYFDCYQKNFLFIAKLFY